MIFRNFTVLHLEILVHVLTITFRINQCKSGSRSIRLHSFRKTVLYMYMYQQKNKLCQNHTNTDSTQHYYLYVLPRISIGYIACFSFVEETIAQLPVVLLSFQHMYCYLSLCYKYIVNLIYSLYQSINHCIT